ncbi:hypothetical protein TRFO_10160 [Tritrichomonas foetus]|uniref:Transmembrane protein n=1 Tax=Tritrichomonas foetus TaxID=1144522 RepID=A0A1J4JAK9_9EUKA|nr:hypothetical protein TRFO_10160 [Tritrichomonas foetus]|eukprot:OHS96210.1 hypothetical protein TRFO_10160 [Tritrichomonas foetus]
MKRRHLKKGDGFLSENLLGSSQTVDNDVKIKVIDSLSDFPIIDKENDKDLYEFDDDKFEPAEDDLFQVKMQKENSPAQNIYFLLIYSLLFAIVFGLTISILLKTQYYVDLDTNPPKRIYLDNFSLDDLHYYNHIISNFYNSISFSSAVNQFEIAQNIFLNIGNNNKSEFRMPLSIEQDVVGDFFSIEDDTFHFNQQSNTINLNVNLVVAGAIRANRFTFGPFVIENNVLTNYNRQNQNSYQNLLLSESGASNFRLSNNFLAVAENDEISIYFMNLQKNRPEKIFQKSFNSKISNIFSNQNRFTFITNEERFSIQCFNQNCEELILDGINDHLIQNEECLIDKFGAKISLRTNNEMLYLISCFESDECTEVQINTNSNLDDFKSMKVGINEEGNPFVVIPKKQIVRIFDDIYNQVSFYDIPINFPLNSFFQPIPQSSTVLVLHDGEFHIMKF